MFVNKLDIIDKILKLAPERAKELEIRYRRVLANLKKELNKGDLNFKFRNIERIVNALT